MRKNRKTVLICVTWNQTEKERERWLRERGMCVIAKESFGWVCHSMETEKGMPSSEEGDKSY